MPWASGGLLHLLHVLLGLLLERVDALLATEPDHLVLVEQVVLRVDEVVRPHDGAVLIDRLRRRHGLRGGRSGRWRLLCGFFRVGQQDRDGEREDEQRSNDGELHRHFSLTFRGQTVKRSGAATVASRPRRLTIVAVRVADYFL